MNHTDFYICIAGDWFEVSKNGTLVFKINLTSTTLPDALRLTAQYLEVLK